MAGDWRPILSADDRDLALERTREIVRALEAARDRGAIPHAGVAGGKAGVALAAAYYGGAGIECGALAEELLGEAVDAVAEEPLDASLYAGFTGIAWAAEHLAGEGAPGDEDANEEIDAALLEHVSRTPWTADYDLVSGLAGYAVYATQRVEHGHESGRRLLEQIVARLDELAVEVPGSPGATWWTSPSLMISETSAKNPEGNYNAGLAHGSPGPIAALGAAIAAGVAEERARPLLERAVAWLLSHRRDDRPGGSRFPYHVPIPPGPLAPCRAAWCYGDPGVAVALLWAGQCAGEPRWIEIATEVARESARRPPESCGVVDAGLCHGAAGLALVFDRIFQATGDEVVRNGAVFWAKRTIEMHEPGRGVGGYRSFFPPAEQPWIDDPGLLTGAAGIALTLVACATEHEPRWDRFLLTSARPR
jgi:hypothetical protein